MGRVVRAEALLRKDGRPMNRTNFVWLAGAVVGLAALIGLFVGSSRADVVPRNRSSIVAEGWGVRRCGLLPLMRRSKCSRFAPCYSLLVVLSSKALMASATDHSADLPPRQTRIGPGVNPHGVRGLFQRLPTFRRRD